MTAVNDKVREAVVDLLSCYGSLEAVKLQLRLLEEEQTRKEALLFKTLKATGKEAVRYHNQEFCLGENDQLQRTEFTGIILEGEQTPKKKENDNVQQPQHDPWDKWLKRKRFRLVRGRHYNCMPHSMGVQVRTAAANRGLRVSVLINEDTLLVEVL